jgi:flagellar hook-associated protein 1 FlgK
MSLFASLQNTSNTFDVLSKAVEVTQNNIANASSPGYVKQRLPIYSRAFTPGSLMGGVAAGKLQSTRQDYAERSVREQVQILGGLTQKKALLSDLEQVFDISGKTGIGAGLGQLFASFSAWGQTPNDSSARRNVITSAERLAAEFNKTANGVTEQSVAAERQTRTTIDEVNRLAGVLRDLNVSRRRLADSDPAMEARMYSTLEELAGFVDYAASFEEDGTVSVSVGGRFPILVGEHQTELSAKYYHPENPANPGSIPPVHLHAGDVDVTGMVTEGKLAALLGFRNQTVPQLTGGPNVIGEINTLAMAFADRVNQISTSAGGPAIFTYDASNPTRAAATLAVRPGVTAGDLVASDNAANDIPLTLAGLSNSQNAADRINGLNYTEFFAMTASAVGSQTVEATAQADVQADVVAQARSLRANVSGVSLNEEAVQLIEYQRAYEAMARLTSVLNEMTETILTIGR